MLNVDPKLFRALVGLLIPYMSDENDRRAILRTTLDDTAFGRIKFGGPADTFTTQMVSDLLQYGNLASGQPAIVALLDVLQDRVGGNNQQAIKALQQKVVVTLNASPKATTRRLACGAPNRPSQVSVLPVVAACPAVPRCAGIGKT